jgi:GH18 family chitinase
MKALANKHYDWKRGAKWYWDSDGGIFWSWDTAFNMRRKLKKIVIPEGLGGIFISSIGQDSHDWHRLKRLQEKARKYFD